MRITRLVATLSALPLIAALSLWGTSGAGAAGPGYVALGDSYSAGVGAGGTIAASGECRRSTRAYPELWAAAAAPASFAFTACDGATTVDVLNGQLGSLRSATGLVSITVGGDDAGFAQVMATCALSADLLCVQRVDRARGFVRDSLPGLLDTVYSAIRARAPHARVVVLGYPRFYQRGGGCLAGLGEAKRTAIDAGIDQLDSVIADRAAAHGFAFGDVRGVFAAHEICGQDPWLHSVTLPVGDSYHPTAAGQSHGYLPVFTAVAG
ncbi:SGNH/GDSL hydrolase family protein [Streptomyces sp. RPT161]|uniref:SGNH/GDSL hydrolase family protein n=1 Tax=Streptomyces sp. RPT161 TaxID=3015993 RepID=UPI0022B8C106|nr:SGNH/GDSL hydrolase family protein [Streptomyces sp. RPT161]